ncbi:MAG TPA: hypothetical protein VKP65_17350 [Rhodothermales bacterium]|nr:hypothetical protein [Rhodothermales bacterium]
MDNRYHRLPATPAEITVATVICRLLAGMGFRLYWATDELTEELYAFQPGEGARSIGETVDHIWDLLHWLYNALEPEGKTKPDGPEALRDGALELIALLEGQFSTIDKDELETIHILKEPFWPIINGPLSDVLTHIGQIATVRRLAGSPAPMSNPFEGTPPPGK